MTVGQWENLVKDELERTQEVKTPVFSREHLLECLQASEEAIKSLKYGEHGYFDYVMKNLVKHKGVYEADKCIARLLLYRNIDSVTRVVNLRNNKQIK